MVGKRLIYSLRCPWTDNIHYIGKTTKGMTRPFQHLKNSHSAKIKKWVEELKELGYKPTIKILETVLESDDLDERERFWIQKSLNEGALLLNDCLVTPLLISNNLDEITGSDEGKEIQKIGRFIKEKRKKINLTQEEFAERAGVALTVVRKIEQGKSNLNLNRLLTILKMFGCSLEVVKINKPKLFKEK